MRIPLQTITELCDGDLTAFYQDKINDMLYFEWWALRLLRVSLSQYEGECVCVRKRERDERWKGREGQGARDEGREDDGMIIYLRCDPSNVLAFSSIREPHLASSIFTALALCTVM